MGKFPFVICCCACCILAVVLHWFIRATREKPDTLGTKCWSDLEYNKTVCTQLCPNGTFSLPGMEECHKWLDCQERIVVISVIVRSVVKTVYLADWKGHQIVMSRLSSPDYQEDFRENLDILMRLGPNSFTVQLLGHCGDAIFTQYYRLGSALNLHFHLNNSLQHFDIIGLRFEFCLQYTRILNFLHTGPLGKRVMCDSSTLEKTLTQYLLTDDLKLVVNDLDAVPQIDDNSDAGIVCGSRPLFGTFVAPEQAWVEEPETFSPGLIKPYNEKVDIWKIPDVCTWFLGNSPQADVVKFRLFQVHKKCKDVDPSKRPTAEFVIEAYERVKSQLSSNK